MLMTVVASLDTLIGFALCSCIMHIEVVGIMYSSSIDYRFHLL